MKIVIKAGIVSDTCFPLNNFYPLFGINSFVTPLVNKKPDRSVTIYPAQFSTLGLAVKRLRKVTDLRSCSKKNTTIDIPVIIIYYNCYIVNFKIHFLLYYFLMPRSFKVNLRDELDYQGLTVKELAAKTGLVKGSIDSYLGKRKSLPTADIAVRIAKALNVSVEYLITGETTLATEIPNYAIYKKVLKELEKLSIDAYKNIEPYLLATIKTEQDKESLKTQKTG